jgi:hypothetical protein
MIEKIHSKRLDQPEAAQIAASAVAIVLHYVDGALLGPEALAAAWTALIVPLVMVGLRSINGLLDKAEEEEA